MSILRNIKNSKNSKKMVFGGILLLSFTSIGSFSNYENNNSFLLPKKENIKNIVGLENNNSSVSHFDNTGVIVDTDGDELGDSLYMWGSNYYGQLGQLGNSDYFGTNLPTWTPTKIEGLPEGEIIDFSIGLGSVGVTIDTTNNGKADSLYTWGSNVSGQLGYSENFATSNPNWTPTKVESLPAGEIIDISMSDYFSGVSIDTTNNGKADALYIWGEINYMDSVSTYVPTKVEGLPKGEIVDFSFGNKFSTVMIDTDYNGMANTLYSWGWNYYGCLGVVSESGTGGTVYTPTHVNSLPDGEIVDIETGANNTGVLMDTTGDMKADSVYMWGRNYYGQLGNETNIETDNDNYIPVKVEGLPRGEIIDFSIGRDHVGVTIDTTNNGKADSIYMWGSNYYGQLGNYFDTLHANTTPTLVSQNIPEGEVVNLSLGSINTSATFDTNGDKKADSLYAWGSNYNGQLGNEINVGTYISNPTPTLVEGIPTYMVDYQIDSIDSIEIGTNNSNIVINTQLNNFQNDSLDEREVKVNISDKFGEQKSFVSSIDTRDGYIVIENNGEFEKGDSYTINSIEYNNTVDKFNGYKYKFIPSSNNVFTMYNTYAYFNTNVESIKVDNFDGNGKFELSIEIIDENNAYKGSNIYLKGYKYDDEDNVPYIFEGTLVSQEKNLRSGSGMYTFSFETNPSTYEFVGVSFTNDESAFQEFDNFLVVNSTNDPNSWISPIGISLIVIISIVVILVLILVIFLLIAKFAGNKSIKKYNNKLDNIDQYN